MMVDVNSRHYFSYLIDLKVFRFRYVDSDFAMLAT